MEQLRMMPQRTRISGTLLANGRQNVRMDLDIIAGPMEVAYRARVCFMTSAFVSIRRRDWMDFQCAVFAADKVQDLALATSGGSLAPIEHLVNAWTATVHYFSEQVRINGSNLKDVINNSGGWESKWVWMHPSRNNTAADLPGNLAHDATTIRELARQQQSATDRARAQDRAAAGLSQQGRRNFGGVGGKGKGKNKDKGRNQRGADLRDGRAPHFVPDRDCPRSRDRGGRRS